MSLADLHGVLAQWPLWPMTIVSVGPTTDVHLGRPDGLSRSCRLPLTLSRGRPSCVSSACSRSLTELVCTLGRRDDLVGVTHECDDPPGVERLPHLTRSRIPGAATGVEIDAMVSDQAGSLYELDGDLLADLRPDLILTQEQCDVCAVNEATVRRAAMAIPGQPRVESVNPTTLAEVFAMFRSIGTLIDREAEADALVGRFEATAREIARRRNSSGRLASEIPRVFLLEWIDPPFASGHWNPEIIHLAGGVDPVGLAGQKVRRIDWTEVAESRPDLIIAAPCGFSLDRARDELDRCSAIARSGET